MIKYVWNDFKLWKGIYRVVRDEVYNFYDFLRKMLVFSSNG
jgi:hypothetical protein